MDHSGNSEAGSRVSFHGFLAFQRLPQLTDARPMEDLALSFPLIPGLVAVSFRHDALRGESDSIRARLAFVAVHPHQILRIGPTERGVLSQRSGLSPVERAPSWETL